MSELHFAGNSELTVGVELELQLIDRHRGEHAFEATELLRRLNVTGHPGAIKPEITQSMIELNSSVQYDYPALLAELRAMRDAVAAEARRLHLGICGGGTHPFQPWSSQRITQEERYAGLSEQYGYLAKQFTVFGQHIHLAVENGDDALYLCHALTRYLPHFVALSASSPFYQGVDTGFACSRLSVVNAFPLSGTPPLLFGWEEFEAYFSRMVELGVVTSMKDFYWDIRPKPEYGTVEIRIGDTPLTVDKAAQIAAYAQMLARALLAERRAIPQETYVVHPINRFRACRYGLDAMVLCPVRSAPVSLADDILATLAWLEPQAAALNSTDALLALRAAVHTRDSDATWLRSKAAKLGSLPDLVHVQVERWMAA